jgi:O-acetyl-ADP-ribose deacetylase (regulator of RNase III)
MLFPHEGRGLSIATAGWPAVAPVRGDVTYGGQLHTQGTKESAHSLLLHLLLVAAAIHRAAGPELLEACRAVPEIRPGIRCPTGEARITPYVIRNTPWEDLCCLTLVALSPYMYGSHLHHPMLAHPLLHNRGFNLQAKHVIHTVGPIYESASESAPLLASAYRWVVLPAQARSTHHT